MSPDAGTLLRLWEEGSRQNAPRRALLLLSLVSPDSAPRPLELLTIGRRDAALLDLREQLFGPLFECTGRCMSCREPFEIGFHVDQIRSAPGRAESSFVLEAEYHEIRFRLPDSADLLAIETLRDPRVAERELLRRCIFEARTSSGSVDAADLPDEIVAAVDRRMEELDPQADVQVCSVCPMCGREAQLPFDILKHLWTELEVWARDLLKEIHIMAVAYGWSESQSLALSAARRCVYLDLIESWR